MESLRYEYMLEGAAKFSPWRERMVLLLEEKGFWEIVKGKVVQFVPTPRSACHV
jgi:hypothetical protein